MVVDLADGPQAASVAADLKVPLVAPDQASDDSWVLVCTHDGIELRSGGFKGPVRVSASLENRRKISRSDALGRALGAGTQTVVDATAGLGTDALSMIRMGFDVQVIESVPVIAVLLKDRLARSGRVAAATTVIEGDAVTHLPKISPAADAVFLDPMFAVRKRASALPRKELVALSELADAVDAEETAARALIDIAMDVATSRVVVKRLPESPQLKGEPNHSLGSKTVRYDVYLT